MRVTDVNQVLCLLNLDGTVVGTTSTTCRGRRLSNCLAPRKRLEPLGGMLGIAATGGIEDVLVRKAGGKTSAVTFQSDQRQRPRSPQS